MLRHQSAYTVDLSRIAHQPGKSLDLDLQMQAPSGIGDAFCGVREHSPVQINGVCDSIIDGLMLTATVRVHVHAQCVRCLKDITREHQVSLAAYFPYSCDGDALDYVQLHAGELGNHGSQEADIIAGTEESEDVYPVYNRGNAIDLEDPLRDTLVEYVDDQPLCSPDCLGLCSQCGFMMQDDPEHHHEVIDDRFAALADWAAQHSEQ